MWIALAVLAVLIIGSMLGSNGYKKVDTALALQAIDANQVQQAKLVGGNDQQLELTLKDGVKIKDSNKIRAAYIEGAGPALQNMLEEKSADGSIPDKFTVENRSQSFLVGLLLTLLPFVLIVVFLLFLMNQMQGGG